MNDYGIPAANIGDTDLVAIALTHPEQAKEIGHLAHLMENGRDTHEEFVRLCQLLCDVGENSVAEILLRRNMDGPSDVAIYRRLFGPGKENEFAAAVSAFQLQFNLTLSLVTEDDFLVTTFHTLVVCLSPFEHYQGQLWLERLFRGWFQQWRSR
jgi:hypothetical protein